MKRKVRITGVTNNSKQLNWPVAPDHLSEPNVEVNKTLKPVPVEEANLEAEKGEFVVTQMGQGGNIPKGFMVGGKRHHDGGTLLNLPEKSFILSRDEGMKIRDKEVLKQFNVTGKSGVTPADIAKKYDLNKYHKILNDPNSDSLQRKTAELMISNYNLKLGKLALAQESIKGFENGIPEIANPYLMMMGINPEELLNPTGMSEVPGQSMARYGGQLDKYQQGGGKKVKPYGDNPYTIPLLKKYGIKLDSDLYTTDIGHQKKSDLGYGTDIPLSVWQENNPLFVKEFKEKNKRDFNPENPEDIRAYESYHPQHTFKTLSEQIAKKSPNLTPEEVAEAAYTLTKDLSFRNVTSAEKAKDVRSKDEKWGHYHRSRRELSFPDVETEKESSGIDIEAGEKDAGTGAAYNKIEEANPMIPAPFWLQDIIKTAGAFGDLARIKKDVPWQAQPATFLPDGTFYDPNRELAANAENANIVSQNLAAFQGPQALSARASQIQGQAAKNAADILGRYNNMNVGVANTLGLQRAQILNQAAERDANLATNLYDKQTIANQQFENSKALARQNLRQSFIDAITNRENTYSLNTLFDQFQVHPEIGGRVTFAKGRKMNAGQPSDPYANAKLFTKFKELMPGATDEAILKIMGAGATSNDDFTQRAMLAKLMGYTG